MSSRTCSRDFEYPLLPTWLRNRSKIAFLLQFSNFSCSFVSRPRRTLLKYAFVLLPRIRKNYRISPRKPVFERFLRFLDKLGMTPDMEKIPCSVEILTRNNEATLARCLESVKDFAEIIILDGNSTDGTRKIAQKFGCRILRQYETDEPLVRIHDFAEVRNKGLNASMYPWFMFIDSDEYLSAEAVSEIRAISADPHPRIRVWWQPRKYVVEGKVIDSAMTYPNRQIRFFHKDAVGEFTKPIHERIKVLSGEVIGTLQKFEYIPMESFGELRKKWRRYIGMEEQWMQHPSRAVVWRHAVRQAKSILLYTWRLKRDTILLRPNRMPLKYEFLRLWFHFRLMARLLRRALTLG